MAPFSPHPPIDPMNVNQAWGTLDPKHYDQFGYSRHNGTDIAISPTGVVRAPFDGTIVRTGFQPTGGGIFCGLLSKDEFVFPVWQSKTPEKAEDGSNDGIMITFPAATCFVLIDFLHMKELHVKEGQAIKAGDVLGIQDNTGFSTGPHTHIQSRREHLLPAPQSVQSAFRYMGDHILMDVDKNDANNTFDISLFWNQISADKIQAVEGVVAAASTLAQRVSASPVVSIPQKLTWIQEIVKALEYLHL